MIKRITESHEVPTPAFEALTDEYMPGVGAGDTMLSGLLVAANKLIYKWYNDGDVFDNTENGLEGFCNDISGSANWLNRYGTPRMRAILDTVYKCWTEDKYGELINKLEEELERFANNEDIVEEYKSKPLEGDPYNESGPYEYQECYDEEEDEWEW